LFALILVLLAGVAAVPGQIAETIAPPVNGGSPRDASTAGTVEQKYLADLSPYLSVVTGEGNRLAELGQARSRNVLELGVRMDRFREASADLVSYIVSNPPPATLASLIDQLMAELSAAETAIQASITAIREFDWDALGISVDAFARAVEAIERLTGQGIK
jgi:hypothetical protein